MQKLQFQKLQSANNHPNYGIRERNLLFLLE